MGGGLFFHDDIFKVRLSRLPVYRRNTKEGKCGAAFSDSSWKIAQVMAKNVHNYVVQSVQF